MLAADTPFSTSRQLRMFYRGMRLHYFRWFTDDMNSAGQSLTMPETRLPRLLKLTIYTLSGTFFCFLLWTWMTPVKEIARTEGQILPSGYNQLVQHLEGGLVREILVHEGDFVQKDQLLMRLDGAGLEEDFQQQKALVTSLRLEAERLHALIENRTPDFADIQARPKDIVEQMQMYQAAYTSDQNELAVIDQQVTQRKNSLPRLEQSLASARATLSASAERLEIYKKLHGENLTSRTAYLKRQEEYNSRNNEVIVLKRQLEEARQQLSEYQHRLQSLMSTQQDQHYTELHRAEAELAQAEENLKKRTNRVARLEVRSPVMGYVKGLTVNTIGSVITSGQTLMEVVPVDETLIVEARILPHQIGRVEDGQEVQVKIDSYDYVRFGSIDGTLQSISAMTFTDENTGEDYFKGRVELQKNYIGVDPSTHLIMPGMTADVDIVTGEKSILSYLLKPIQVAMQNALTEQ